MENSVGDKEIFIPCTCECTVIKVVRSKNDGDWWISSYVREWDSLQQNIWRVFVHRIKLAWKVLRGKEYWFYDTVVNDTNMQEFMDFVKENM
jgi:hypothetical protein